MAVAKSGKVGNEERKGSRKMSREKTSGLSSIRKSSLTDQSEGEIINVRHHFCATADGKSGSVFFKSNIAPIMGTGFNSPMSAANFQEFRSSRLAWANLGQAVYALSISLVVKVRFSICLCLLFTFCNGYS
jgi:hypothetical protein